MRIIHNMVYTKFYRHWCLMKNRCKYPTNDSYYRYGGRGIKYDPRWEKFINFYNDMYFKYVYAKKKYGEKCLSIERFDVNGNYCFENCDFIPLKEQYSNMGRQKWFRAISPIGIEYIEKNLKKFCDKHKLHRGNMIKCLNREKYRHKISGWKVEYIMEGGD